MYAYHAEIESFNVVYVRIIGFEKFFKFTLQSSSIQNDSNWILDFFIDFKLPSALVKVYFIT